MMNRFARLSLVALLAVAFGAVALAAPQPRLKMRVAVAPLDWSEKDNVDNWQIPASLRNAIYNKLVDSLLKTGRFVVLEREALDALLREQEIKEANTGQPQKGKLVPAQAMVAGKITDFELERRGGGAGVTVGRIGRVSGEASEAKVALNVRIFDVDSSELLGSETASGSASSAGFNVGVSLGSVFTDFGAFNKSPLGQATTKAIEEAVKKIVKRLDGQPWTAMVADWDAANSELTVNAGSEQGVRVGDVFEVVRLTGVVKDPETGAVLRRKFANLGVLKVTAVEEKYSLATPIDGKEFQTGDLVRAPKREKRTED